MRYEMRLTAYDVMDMVQVAVVLESLGDGQSEVERRLVLATVVQGVGRSDPDEWMRDALVAALENL